MSYAAANMIKSFVPLEEPVSTLNIFDFDGVLGHPIEEALFTMPETQYDSKFIEKMSWRHGLDLQHESRQSARYICIQAALQDLGIPIEKGPKFDLIPSVGAYHILTARSDRFAVARMHEFLDYNVGNLPIKTMHVCSTKKALVLKMLLAKYSKSKLVFWDDNINHIHYANGIDSSRLVNKHVDNDMKDHYQDAVTLYETKLVKFAL